MKVIVRFIDLQDGNHVYEVGDEYPYDGKQVDPKRVKELSTDENKRHMPLIIVEEKKTKKKK